MAKTAKQAYFIGANTARGFVNYTDEIFQGLRKLYILKGGPGTGKSTLMKRVAEAAEAKGITVERYYCSSDSDSLDGIVLREISVGITDGTAPHSMEAKYPGAREEYLDPGAYWDRRKLENHFETIKGMADEKAQLFATVYKYLSVGLALRTERNHLLKTCLDEEKLDKAAARWIRKVGTGNGFSLHSKQIHAIGMKGDLTLDTYTDMAKEWWHITDSRGLRGIVLDNLLLHAEQAGLTVWVSRDPMLETEALYFPEKQLAITKTGEADSADKILNTERFVLREMLAEQRTRLRFLTRLEHELTCRASDLFAEIRTRHFAIEALYADAMDFSGVDTMTENLIRQLGL